MKFPSENPWNGAAEKFAVGNIVKGKVARMTDFGAFVELAPFHGFSEGNFMLSAIFVSLISLMNTFTVSPRIM